MSSISPNSQQNLENALPVPPETSIHDTGNTFQEETETALVAWSEPTSVEIIPGFQMTATMSFQEKKRLLQRITAYTGAKSTRVDDYLNTEIPCWGVITHPCTVRSKQPVINRETGEQYYPLIPSWRSVFKRADSELMLAFVSSAVKEFLETFVFPIFGPGPWEEPITFVFRQVSTNNGGRTYQAQIVE